MYIYITKYENLSEIYKDHEANSVMFLVSRFFRIYERKSEQCHIPHIPQKMPS